MPAGGILPTDPNDIISQLLSTPSYGPGNTPEQDLYADRPAQDTLAHILATGQVPTSQAINPGGPISAIGQKLGLLPTSGPVPQSVLDRAKLAQQQQGQQAIARKLAEIQALGPQAQWFGSNFGRSALQQIDPSMANVYPQGMAGKGQAELTGQQLKAQTAESAIQQKADQAQLYAQVREAIAANQIDRANALVTIAQEREGISQENVNIQQSKLD